MTRYVRVNLALPQHIADAFAAFEAADDKSSRNQLMKELWNNKWTLESIAQAAGGISRERVRQIIRDTTSSTALAINLEIPTPPVKPERTPRTYAEPKPEVLKRLLELQPFAQRVRSNSPAFRAESEEYSALVYKTHIEDGVSMYRLAKRLGITHSALQFRMIRYGYKPASLTARSKVYNRIKDSNRIVK